MLFWHALGSWRLWLYVDGIWIWLLKVFCLVFSFSCLILDWTTVSYKSQRRSLKVLVYWVVSAFLKQIVVLIWATNPIYSDKICSSTICEIFIVSWKLFCQKSSLKYLFSAVSNTISQDQGVIDSWFMVYTSAVESLQSSHIIKERDFCIVQS